MNNNNQIVLRNLVVSTTSPEGRIGTTQVTINVPTPCEQSNAKGNLRQQTLEDMRTNAKSHGVAAAELLTK